MQLNKPLNFVVIILMLSAVVVTYRILPDSGASPFKLDQLTRGQEQPVPENRERGTDAIAAQQQGMLAGIRQSEGNHEQNATSSRLFAGDSVTARATTGSGAHRQGVSVAGRQRPVTQGTGMGEMQLAPTSNQTTNLLPYENGLVGPGPGENDLQIFDFGPGENDPQIFGPGPGENEPQLLGPGPGES